MASLTPGWLPVQHGVRFESRRCLACTSMQDTPSVIYCSPPDLTGFTPARSLALLVSFVHLSIYSNERFIQIYPGRIIWPSVILVTSRSTATGFTKARCAVVLENTYISNYIPAPCDWDFTIGAWIDPVVEEIWSVATALVTHRHRNAGGGLNSCLNRTGPHTSNY